jgi:N-carbamoyl-L-amino-acid hydrolase
VTATSARLLAAGAVDGERLVRHHRQLAQIGATPDGGVRREAFTDEDVRARELVIGWAAARGFAVESDPFANMFIRRAGQRPDLPPVVTGSHIDSQPAGGAFDGAYGVLAGWEALEAIDDAGIETTRSIELAIWTNEEGSRFQPTTMGSAVFAGALSLAEVFRASDAAGHTAGDALRQLLTRLDLAVRREFAFPMHAFVEAHIEQGPLLERAGKTIGAVHTIQGLRWFRIRVHGQTAHAGTTPAAERRDALMAAVSMVEGLSELMRDPSDVVRFTVGRFEVRPGSPNTIPEDVLFTVDFRHPDSAVLSALGDQVETVCRARAGRCEVAVEESLDAPPTVLDAQITQMVRDAGRDLGIELMDIDSGATHDAKYLAGLCPTAMIFIPCRNGVSHTPAEHAEPADMIAGARVLAAVVTELAIDVPNQ